METTGVLQPGQRPRTARELGIMCGHPPPPEKRPTLENWDLAPFNRWSFQNVRALFPTTEVFRGTGPQSALRKDFQDLGGLRFTAHNGRRQSIDSWLEESYTDGFLVYHRGRVVTEQYFNDMTPYTLHLSQSVAKSLVGILAGILEDEGSLDLAAPLSDLVPELERCGYADATPGQVLDMRSGVRFIEDYGAPHSDMTRIDIASGWRPAPAGGPPPTIRDVILTLPKLRAHGGRFEYRSVETDVLAWAMERATGQSLAQLMSDRIWTRLGAERDACFTVDSAGTALADGGFNATLRDYARVAILLLNGGRLGDATVVPESWIESCRTGERSGFGAPYTDISPRGTYRRQWWIHDIDRGDIMARGVFGQFIYIDREADFAAVKLSTWPDYLIPGFTLDTLGAVLTIRHTLAGG